MNKIFLIGNLTHDPELRTTPNGVSVCTFSIAVSRRFTPQGGERVTDFFRITTWRQSAENCAKYLAKGRKVGVVGELQMRTYETKEGETRFSLEVTADEVEFLTPKQQDGESGEARYTPYPQQNSSAQSPLPAGCVDVSDDDLPF